MDFCQVSADEARHAHEQGLLDGRDAAIERCYQYIMAGGGHGGPVDLDWQAAIEGDITNLCSLLEQASKGYMAATDRVHAVVGKALMDWFEGRAWSMAEKEYSCRP